MIFVRSCPARPTNGIPWMSSSPPGASPTNIRSASGLPTPNTICLRPIACSLQRVQSPISVRTAARASAELRENVAGWPSSRRSSRGCRGATLPARVRQAPSRLTPATPSSAANLRCSLICSRSMGGEHPFHPVENVRRDARLRLQRQRFRSVWTDDDDRVGVDVEAGVGAGHVVGDDEVDVFFRALFGRTRVQCLCYGRDTYEFRSLGLLSA